MNKKIIVINGIARSGKDTFCELSNGIVQTMTISSVDKIKESAKILGWEGGKTELDRKFLADLKFMSSNYNDHSYQYIKSKIEEFKSNDDDKILYVHIREPFEINRIKNDFNAITLLIKNDRVEEIISNKADANVHNYEYDYVIENNGTLLELAEKAHNFIKELGI